jgi:hypothetical protein
VKEFPEREEDPVNAKVYKQALNLSQVEEQNKESSFEESILRHMQSNVKGLNEVIFKD